MITFRDGPAAGTLLQLRRSPFVLRVVVADDGTIDALDQLDDEPEAGESIHVYRMVEDRGSYHLWGTDERGRRTRFSGRSALYALVEHPPDDETARETELWRAWNSLNDEERRDWERMRGEIE